jgi:2-polyprenyl-6-methoxyphenol hydroxylase-like FAD-dependent oxidoreductase
VAAKWSRCLRDLPHPAAFAAYERPRRSRVERIIKLAARTSHRGTTGLAAAASMR